jgi:hypothetical protein
MFDFSFIKRIAKMYRDTHPDYSIQIAVHKAYEAYEFYKESEIEILDEQLTKEQGY